MATHECPEYRQLHTTWQCFKDDVNSYRENRSPRRGKEMAKQLAANAQSKANDAFELLNLHTKTCEACKRDGRS
jgi:hypothetical protein